MSLLQRLFPESLATGYDGPAPALWILFLIACMKLAMGLTHIFKRDGGAQSVSKIPLDAYPPGAAQNVVAVFARLGLEQLLLGLTFMIVLARYHALVPLMLTLAVISHVGMLALGRFKPLALTGRSGARLPLQVLAVLSVIGFTLSLW